MTNNNLEYYNDSSLYGEYQYINLEDIVNDLQAIKKQNQFLSSIPRADLISAGKRAIRDLTIDVAKDIKAIELEINSSLNLVLPEDFIDYVRLSYIDDEGQLRPIAKSNHILLAQSYLQDNDGNILFDNDGNVITSELGITGADFELNDRNLYHEFSFTPNIDLTKSNPNKFRVDKEQGIIRFNSSIEGKNVVLEYISDGLNSKFGTLTEVDIKIHKKLQDAIMDAIYYRCIKYNSSAPDYEKRRARKEYYNSKRIAKKRMNTLRREEVLQAFSGASRWIQ
jgi:hypothetical protein